MATDPAILQATGAAIERAGQMLRNAALVAFPTETVYGLGANALDATAVARIFDLKGRPTFDPLIVHLADPADARALAAAWPQAATKLAEALWPGPLTLVVTRNAPPAAAGAAASPNSSIVADLVTAGLPSVGLRVPAHPVARALIRAAGVPIAAPSANRFGAISPTRPEHVVSEFAGRGDALEIVLDGGPCDTGVESTVVSVVGDRPVVLRVGGVSVEAIEAVVGKVELAQPGAAVASPGMLERHYAPRTPLTLADGKWRTGEHGRAARGKGRGERVGVLCFRGVPASVAQAAARVEVLSPTGDLREAAGNLFAAMRRLDGAGLDVILAEPVPEEGLGRAINDRLRRASVR